MQVSKKHYIELKLPIKINKFFKQNKINKIVSFMQKDKKNSNSSINLVLIKRIGKMSKPIIMNFSKSKIKKFLNDFY